MNTSSLPLLQVANIKKVYKDAGQKDLVALNNLSFCLHQGEILGVIGESGCGKSTLAKVLTGLERPTSGTISFPMNQTLHPRKKKQWAKTVQMIYQNPFDVFDPRITVGRAILSTAMMHRLFSSWAEGKSFLQKELLLMGFTNPEEIWSRYPNELSGGQLQRLAILRSVMLNPSILIADEAVSMLDVSIRFDIISLLLRMVKERKMSMIFISHDMSTTKLVSDTLCVMYLGHIVEFGPGKEIFTQPVHPYTKALLSNCRQLLRPVHPIELTGPFTRDVPSTLCPFCTRCFAKEPICKSDIPPYQEVSKGHFVYCHTVT